jgi:hypothetical protein
MTANFVRSVSGLAALVMSVALVGDVSACGACGGATTAYYQPTAYTTAYAPAYTSYYAGSGWYPGYWLDRVSQSVWGTPTTYTVAYPSTYTASYAPAYSVGYATAYAAPACSSCSTCSTCTAGYAPCSTCATTVTMRPVCETACGCTDCSSTCSSCSGGGCSSCGQTETVVSSGVIPTGGSSGVNPPPDLPSDANVPEVRRKPTTEEADKLSPGPADENTPAEAPGTTPPAGDATDGTPSTYFEAPKLFIPNDRTAARVAAPVRKALYERPVAARQVSTGRITAAQAERDAAGWTSASN